MKQQGNKRKNNFKLIIFDLKIYCYVTLKMLINQRSKTEKKHYSKEQKNGQNFLIFF